MTRQWCRCLRAASICAVVLMSLIMFGPRVPAQPPAAAMLAQAKAALDSAHFDVAHGLYDRAIAAATDSATRGDGYFGRAYAAHRQLTANHDSLAVADARKIAEDYQRAGVFKPSLAPAAASNAAAALQSAGLNDAAVQLLRNSMRRPGTSGRGGRGGTGPVDVSALLRIAALYEGQRMYDSAHAYFSRVLAADSGSTLALGAMLRFEARRGAVDSLLRRSVRSLQRPGGAALVEDALLSYLETPSARGPLADSSLVLCARAWALMGLGPASFSQNEDPRLRRILSGNPDAKPVIDPMLDAYRPRVGDEVFRDPGGWWHRNVSRLAAWSRLLRSLGDSYNGSGQSLLAESYYEAAVGFPNPQFEQSWIDLDALLPLALLYEQRAAGRQHSDELVRRVDELTEMLWYGKMRAIEAGDYQRIRYFHMTLGSLFAAEERWGEGARGAVYQLQNMRRMTAKVNEATHAGLTDPPELLEKLAHGYQVVGQPDSARRVAVETVAAYRRLGKTADAVRVAGLFRVPNQ